jgi:hypothetical protein
MNEKHPSNGFNTVLAEVRRGEVLDELSQALKQTVAAVRATGKKGKLTLELAISPVTKGEIGESIATYITADVQTKLPRPDKKASIFFTTSDDHLQRTDPNQKELELRTVQAAAPAPLREVAQAPKAAVG